MTTLEAKEETEFNIGPPTKKSRLSLSRKRILKKSDAPLLGSSAAQPTSSDKDPETPPPVEDQKPNIKKEDMQYDPTSSATLAGTFFSQQRVNRDSSLANGYLTGSETEGAKSSTDDSPSSETMTSTGTLHMDRLSPVGTLCNLGNTCFLNSVLYTLRFAPHFMHNLHHLTAQLREARKQHIGLESEKAKIQVVTERLHDLYMSLHTAELKKDPIEPIQPDVFLHALREVNPIFEGNQQHDAHELLVCLLDNIRETCCLLRAQDRQNSHTETTNGISENHVMPPPPPPPSPQKTQRKRKSWRKGKWKSDKEEEHNTIVNGFADSKKDADIKKPPSNFISEDFEGVTVQMTTCMECEHVTERKESFCDICVPIATDQDMDEDDLPKSPSEFYHHVLMTREHLRDLNKYWCEQCLRYNEAWRSVRYETLPRLLVLQIKRFSSTFGSMVCVSKVNDYMATPLALACFCECCRAKPDAPDHHYRLYGVIMHLGATIASGHYVAYVRASDNMWNYYHCDQDKSLSVPNKSNEKSGGLLKFFKPKSNDSSRQNHSQHGAYGSAKCRSVDCCSVRMNRVVMDAFLAGGDAACACIPNGEQIANHKRGLVNKNSHSPASDKCYSKNNSSYLDAAVPEDVWFECDDETIHLLTRKEFEDILAPKPSKISALTPYLLFYTRCP